MRAIAALLVVAGLIAAGLMGGICLVTEDWQAQFIVFSLLAVVAASMTAWRWLRQRRRKRYFQRQRLIGRMATVQQTIPIGQRGDVLIDGALWVAAAPTAQSELQRGDRVKITRIDGVLLLVELVNEISQKPPAPQGDTGGSAE